MLFFWYWCHRHRCNTWRIVKCPVPIWQARQRQCIHTNQWWRVCFIPSITSSLIATPTMLSVTPWHTPASPLHVNTGSARASDSSHRLQSSFNPDFTIYSGIRSNLSTQVFASDNHSKLASPFNISDSNLSIQYSPLLMPVIIQSSFHQYSNLSNQALSLFVTLIFQYRFHQWKWHQSFNTASTIASVSNLSIHALSFLSFQ